MEPRRDEIDAEPLICSLVEREDIEREKADRTEVLEEGRSGRGRVGDSAMEAEKS